MTLEDWQARLDRHFEALSGTRRPRDRPVFALEHGLTPQEIDALEDEIRFSIQRHDPSKRCWLPWVVYAAEIGYRYLGDEYWQTFEADTPGWTERGDRAFIRRCFLEFHRRYSGARPAGRWAQHFTIICWPITHAILPKDLQRELAKLLHDMRFDLTSDAFSSPTVLGAQIAARNTATKPRFLQFLEETALAGLIASALLSHGKGVDDEIVEPSSLERIVKDLDSERTAGAWLREAQRVAHLVTLRGFASRGLTGGGQTAGGASRRAPSLEPRFVLRPGVADLWDVFCEVPDLSPLLQSEDYRETLTSTRCTVEGAPRPLARGRVLWGTNLVRLDRWPAPGRQLIHFESSPESLAALLARECALPPGPPWVFRVRSDGLAYEIRTRLVRPDRQYVIAWLQGSAPNLPFLQPMKSSCAGLELSLLDVPAKTDAIYEEVLAKLQIGVARSLRLWPVGLPPVSWDGEGHLVYLTTDSPILAVQADHDLPSLSLQLAGAPETAVCVGAVRSNAPVFFELPTLPAGQHTVEFLSEGPAGSAAHTRLEVAVRTPDSWLPGRSSHRLLFLEASPAQPSFEDLLQGRVSIAVHGPTARKVTPYLTLDDPITGGSPLVEKRLSALMLPVDEDAWRRVFSKALKADDVWEMADSASFAELRFDAEELGVLTLQCSRMLTPIRWVVRRVGNWYRLRLVDDSSEVERVAQYALDAPDRRNDIAVLNAMQGFAVPDTGGLYVASGTSSPNGVLLPRRLMRGFDALRAKCTFESVPRTPGSVEALLGALEVWANARTVGGAVTVRFRQQVVEEIRAQLVSLLCGGSWAATERSVRARRLNPAGLRVLYEAVSSVPRERRIVSRFFSECTAKRVNAVQFLELFHSTVNQLGFGRDRWLAEALLRLVDTPEDFRKWAGNRSQEVAESCLRMITASRFARYALLARSLRADWPGSWSRWAGTEAR